MTPQTMRGHSVKLYSELRTKVNTAFFEKLEHCQQPDDKAKLEALYDRFCNGFSLEEIAPTGMAILAFQPTPLNGISHG